MAEQAATMSPRKWRIIGPGIVVAATGVGAGDLVATLVAGSNYGYLLLYIAAYMLDDLVILSIGVALLSRHRLQEREGRWLKLISGLVMVGLGVYLVLQ